MQTTVHLGGKICQKAKPGDIRHPPAVHFCLTPKKEEAARGGLLKNTFYELRMKFSSMVTPSGVMMDSGWNCTP